MKLGISTLHNETIRPDKPQNFDLFFEFLNMAGIQYEIIDSKLTILEELEQYSSILIGAPEGNFTEKELSILRQYVALGGNLLIILKYGGNNVLGTNIGNLFAHIKANDDMLINSRRNHHRPYQPLVKMSVHSPRLYFEGDICYDAGCTFDLQGDVDLAIYPDEGNHARQIPRWQRNRYNYSGQSKTGAIFVYDKIDKGSIIYWGARWSFSNEIFKLYQNSCFYRKMLALFCSSIYQENLRLRMECHQRHRLLHGYPMRSGLKKYTGSGKGALYNIDLDTSKSLAIGIIPHSFCNPTVRGCGFCTFPQEAYYRHREKECVDAVISELQNLIITYPDMAQRRVSSIYFGGGTANLINEDSFTQICQAVNTSLRVNNHTEITFEGAPIYFAKKRKLLDIFCEAFPKSKLRISMGVQTFEPQLLALMGRNVLNRKGSVEKAIELAQERNINISIDFLFNLPGQKFAQIEADIHYAAQLGLEHICVYNLVCFEGLGTEWSKNSEIIRNLPSFQDALGNWLRLYELLCRMNYDLVTVTDFQLQGSGEQGRYVYEEDLRRPEDIDWLGIGPYAISLFVDQKFTRAIKLMNPEGASPYIEAQREYGIPWEKFFSYTLDDLKIYWITRQVKRAKISRNEYLKLFGSAIEDDYFLEIQSCLQQNLLKECEAHYLLTPKGMYYSDSIAGLFAWLRVSELSVRELEGEVSKKREWNISVAEWMG